MSKDPSDAFLVTKYFWKGLSGSVLLATARHTISVKQAVLPAATRFPAGEFVPAEKKLMLDLWVGGVPARL